MRTFLHRAALALLLIPRAAGAEPPAGAGAEEPAAPSTPAPDEGAAGSQPPPEAAAAVEEPEPVPPAPADDEAALPPPATPSPADQAPRPYLFRPRPEQPLRNVEIGPHAGLWWRSADGDGVVYEPDFAFGVDIRVNLWRWLAVRAIVSRTTPAVGGEQALGPAASVLEQPALGITYLAARLEPTLELTPSARLWAGPEVGWARVVAPRPVSRDGSGVQGAERAGAILDLGLAAGASLDLLRDWLVLDLTLRAGFATRQTGQIFEPSQAIDDGRLAALGALPRFAASVGGLLGMRLVL